MMQMILLHSITEVVSFQFCPPTDQQKLKPEVQLPASANCMYQDQSDANPLILSSEKWPNCLSIL